VQDFVSIYLMLIVSCKLFCSWSLVLHCLPHCDGNDFK